MSGVGDAPELFGGGFGVIKAIDHFCGDVCVFFAMDEEDGLLAFGDLLQWGCLTECPSVFHAAEAGGDVHEREGGQGELFPQLSAEFVPHGGETTICHKTFDV